ncbi:MAG: carbohydrate kinase family protein [Chloroflexota bacterium]|nr:MAG: carbohydrate kinase family protein [Chloroflexota bacterium]
MAETLLLGTISLDRYLGTPVVLPGGGILNMAWHWRELGRPFRVVTRVGAEDGEPILAFLAAHAIEVVGDAVEAPGRSSSIDIAILADRQPDMQHFEAGVWDGFRATVAERSAVAAARYVHTVLTEGAIAELGRLGDEGALSHLTVSADFLGFRHYTVERLARTMANVDLGFIGWPGDVDAPEVRGMRDVAFDLGRLLVVTMGSRAIRVFDGRAEPLVHTFAVSPVEVAGTTLGCGDAFIAWFLDELWRSDDLDRAIERGKAGGAAATRWLRPLPDAAYPTLASATVTPNATAPVGHTP